MSTTTNKRPIGGKGSTHLKALPGEEVWVRNYRRDDEEWERGEVFSVTTSWDRIGLPRNSYTVFLHRRGAASGLQIRLCVGDEDIKP